MSIWRMKEKEKSDSRDSRQKMHYTMSDIGTTIASRIGTFFILENTQHETKSCIR